MKKENQIIVEKPEDITNISIETLKNRIQRNNLEIEYYKNNNKSLTYGISTNNAYIKKAEAENAELEDSIKKLKELL